MRKFFFVAFAFFLTNALLAQSDSIVKHTLLTSRGLPKSNDHFMIQLGYTQWSGKPDTINTSGVPRSVNIYFMLDYPFRTNPHLSAAIGLGIASDNIYFSKTNIGIKENTSSIRFRNVTATSVDTAYFKKYKLATSYLEVPVELRYSAHPDDDRKSIKVAVGVKVGMLLNAHTKGRILQNRNGKIIGDYKEKEFSKHFFNQNRLSATARIGYGHISIFGSYQLTSLFKEGLGPTVRPLTIGLNISGL